MDPMTAGSAPPRLYAFGVAISGWLEALQAHAISSQLMLPRYTASKLSRLAQTPQLSNRPSRSEASDHFHRRTKFKLCVQLPPAGQHSRAFIGGIARH